MRITRAPGVPPAFASRSRGDAGPTEWERSEGALGGALEAPSGSSELGYVWAETEPALAVAPVGDRATEFCQRVGVCEVLGKVEKADEVDVARPIQIGNK